MVLDPSAVPMMYDALKIFSDVVGSATARLEVVGAQQAGSSGWQRTRKLTIDVRDVPEFDESWHNDIQAGTKHILCNTWVAADDCHIDAKLFVAFHPYGTGSLQSEGSSCGLHRLVKTRLYAMQNCFRASSTYGFWFLPF